MILPEDVAMVIAPSNVVPGSARTVGDGLEFQIDGHLTTGSIGIIVQMMGFDGIGFPNCMARVVAAHQIEGESRFKIVVRPPHPLPAGPTVNHR